MFHFLYKVLVKNLDTDVRRIGQAIVLDPPKSNEVSGEDELPQSEPLQEMLVFPSYDFPPSGCARFDCQVSYLSSILAFNLNLHVSCLKSLVHQGKENLSLLFDAKVGDKINENGRKDLAINLGVEAWSQSLKYASHLRASFVKIPDGGTLESLRGTSCIETDDRQELIDLALNDYFSVDRYLARGDIFSICIKWNCKSPMCIPCSQNMHDISDAVIYFKVII